MAAYVVNSEDTKKLSRLNFGPKAISPIFISRDLHSPAQRGRITTPFISVQTTISSPKGVATWGENVTEYGGIGTLPFFGNRREKNILAPRDQKHYSSGFTKYKTQLQPYRNTPLALSAGRLNDQILPPNLTQRFEDRYVTHVSRNEVFPTLDPDRIQHGLPVLTSATRSDLMDYYRNLYCTGSHTKAYPEHNSMMEHYIRQSREDRKRAEFEQSRKYYDRSPGNGVQQKYDTTKKQIQACLIDSAGPRGLAANLIKLLNDVSLEEIHEALSCLLAQRSIKENVLAHHVMKLIEEVLNDSSDRRSQIHRVNCFLMRVLSGRITLPLRHELLRPDKNHLQPTENTHCGHRFTGRPDRLDSTNSPIAGLGMIWPPNRSQIMERLQLPLRDIQSPTLETKYHAKTNNIAESLDGRTFEKPHRNDLRNMNHRGYEQEWRDKILGFPNEPKRYIIPGLQYYRRYLNEFIPTKLPEGNQESVDEGFHSFPERSGVLFHEATEQTPPSLSAMLQPTGNRIQDRLGSSFRHEALLRYKALHTDKVPDLRDFEVLKKRYFFLGNHSSVFRG